MLQRFATKFGLAVLVTVATTGCFVNVTHVSNPDRYFGEAMRSARSVAGQEGPARELHVLVYDAADRKLVRVDLPLGLVGRLSGDADFNFDFDDNDYCESSRHSCSEARKRLRKFRGKDLAKLPLGPLVEVNDDDGERVFVYLR